MRRFGSLLAAGAIVLSLGVTVPARAQSIVFDPNNYAQNVLTAARALQQINNQITSLQNQAQMLINQAKNLVNLPYSSLQQLQSSIQRTQQLLGTLDRRLQLLKRRIRQIYQVLRLIDQHLRLVLQRGDLIVDLLQRPRRGQDVLGVIVGIENYRLRSCGHRDAKREDDSASSEQRAKTPHSDLSRLPRLGIKSVAQATPRCWSQAGTKPSRPCSASSCSMAAWSVLEEAAVKARATSPRPSSNIRLPRRDWQ